jgi:replicative DNA helicase
MSKLEFLDEDCFYVNDFKKIFNAIKKTNSTDFTTLAVES